jgi:hypothetical protein
MQHPDEGTIHSWLDGALSADEGARVEAHVEACPKCAAAVAEARGFIAAASRILTALDNVPRGVIPATAPRKRIDPLVWRVAATFMVVAAGTLVVVQNRAGNDRPSSVATDSALVPPKPTSVAEQVPAATGPASAAAGGAGPKAPDAPAPALSVKSETQSSRSDAAARENKALAAGTTAGTTAGTIARIRQQNAAAPGDAAAVAPTAPAISRSRMAGGVALDAATQPELLKVIDTPRRFGAKVTLYVIAPGDTVTLTESLPLNLEQVVVTGITGAAAGAPTARRATAKAAALPSKALADAAIAAAPDSQRAVAVASSPPAFSALGASRAEIARASHTISWIDSATGNALTLTGRMPEERLQEIKTRIERERAAAAAKKSP